MRKIIIFLGLLVILSSFVSAAFSTDRTDYYWNGTYYFTDGIEDTDIALDGNVPSNGDKTTDYGWGVPYTTANYSNAQKEKGDLSIYINSLDTTNRGIETAITNASFVGKVGYAIYPDNGIGILIYVRDSASTRNDLKWDNRETYITYIDNGGSWTATSQLLEWDGWHYLVYNFTDSSNLGVYYDGSLLHNFESRSGFNLIWMATSGSGNAFYIDDFWISNGERPEDTTPPTISGLNCTSCDVPNGDDESPYETEDTTPTFNFNTSENAWCAIDVNDLNYTAMGDSRNCTSGEGTQSHICTLPVGAAFENIGENDLYISCKDSSGNEGNASDTSKSNSGSIKMVIWGATETSGDDMIELAIDTSEIEGIVDKYKDQQISARKLDGDQFTGTFDWVAVVRTGNKRYAFNYVSSGESKISNLFNLTPVLYVLQLQNQTNTTIINEVRGLINDTYP
jgi:hypothetical protein